MSNSEVIQLAKLYRNDLKAWMSDLVGLRKFTDDQELHIQALQIQDTVAAMGSPSAGKSFVEGLAALWKMTLWFPTSCFFGAPTETSAFSQAWKYFSWAYHTIENRAMSSTGKYFLNGELQRYSYSLGADVEREIPDAVIHWAKIKACPRGEDGSSLRGQLHAKNSLVLLQEINGIDASAVDSLWYGSRAKGAKFWFSFNPIEVKSGRDSAKELWGKTPEAGRVQYSLLRALEWQDRNGNIPGMTDREIFKRDFEPLRGTALWYPLVEGIYAPESEESVVVPENWFEMCINVIQEPTQEDLYSPVLGIDTGGGISETGGIGVQGRIVLPARTSREKHDTIRTAVTMKEYANQLGQNTVAVVDWIGTGGKGVGEQLAALDVPVVVFRGGSRTITQLIGIETEKEIATCPDSYSNIICWAYMSVRDAVRKTIEAIKAGRSERFISFNGSENDLGKLKEQLARKFSVDPSDRKFILEKKIPSNSPDRADMCCMAWLIQQIQKLQPPTTEIVTMEDILPGALDIEIADYGVRNTIESGDY